MNSGSYYVASLISLFLFGLGGLFLGEEAYRRAELFWLDPATLLGQRTRLSGRPARMIGITLMVFGALALFIAIMGIFLPPTLRFAG